MCVAQVSCVSEDSGICVCVGFSAEESCSAVCHFSFRPVEQRDFYYEECAREGAIALKKKKVQFLYMTVKYSEKYVLFMQEAS